MQQFIAVAEGFDVYKIIERAETCIEVIVSDELVGNVTIGMFQSFDQVFGFVCRDGRQVSSAMIPRIIPNKNFSC